MWHWIRIHETWLQNWPEKRHIFEIFYIKYTFFQGNTRQKSLLDNIASINIMLKEWVIYIVFFASET